MAYAMQLAIALLTAGLDSPELETWAADALTPLDADGLADFMAGFMAGLHVVSVLLYDLHEATGEPVGRHLAKGWRSWRSTGGGHPPPAGAAPLPYHCRLPRTWHEVIK